MQEAVNRQEREFPFQGDVVRPRLTFGGLDRDHDIAEHSWGAFGQREAGAGVFLRKREDVGGAIDASPELLGSLPPDVLLPDESLPPE